MTTTRNPRPGDFVEGVRGDSASNEGVWPMNGDRDPNNPSTHELARRLRKHGLTAFGDGGYMVDVHLTPDEAEDLVQRLDDRDDDDDPNRP